LGDMTRLAIADLLGVEDASPGELADAFGLWTNLVPHHVHAAIGGLGGAGALGGGSPSTYVRLLPAALPTLRTAEVRGASGVFVCTHNSARS
jgi:hypothetical protein